MSGITPSHLSPSLNSNLAEALPGKTSLATKGGVILYERTNSQSLSREDHIGPNVELKSKATENLRHDIASKFTELNNRLAKETHGRFQISGIQEILSDKPITMEKFKVLCAAYDKCLAEIGILVQEAKSYDKPLNSIALNKFSEKLNEVLKEFRKSGGGTNNTLPVSKSTVSKDNVKDNLLMSLQLNGEKEPFGKLKTEIYNSSEGLETNNNIEDLNGNIGLNSSINQRVIPSLADFGNKNSYLNFGRTNKPEENETISITSSKNVNFESGNIEITKENTPQSLDHLNEQNQKLMEKIEELENKGGDLGLEKIDSSPTGQSYKNQSKILDLLTKVNSELEEKKLKLKKANNTLRRMEDGFKDKSSSEVNFTMLEVKEKSKEVKEVYHSIASEDGKSSEEKLSGIRRLTNFIEVLKLEIVEIKSEKSKLLNAISSQ